MTSKLYRFPFLPALLLTSLAVTGCASSTKEEKEGARSVKIVVEEYKFTPNRITAEPEEQLDIELYNEGKMEHSIEFDLPGQNQALDKSVAPNETGHLYFTAPSEPGSYPFFSPIDDDRERGLLGQLVVTARPSRR